MSHHDLARSSMGRLFGVVAALALTGCSGGLMVTDAPSRSLRAEARHGEVEGRSGAGRAGPSERGGARVAEGGVARAGAARAEPEVELEPSDAPYYVAPEAARAVDLEFSEGLPAPTQEQVVAPPPAWKPEPQAEVAADPRIEDVWPNQGPASGGEVVVIKGQHLQASTVLFGMAPARILEATAEAVKVAVPEYAAGEVAVVVTNRDGAYAVAMHAFRYYR